MKEKTQQPYASLIMKRIRLGWFDHIQRMDPHRIPHRLYYCGPTAVGGRRKQGRQKQCWVDACSRDLGTPVMTVKEGEALARNRGEWRLTLAALM